MCVCVVYVVCMCVCMRVCVCVLCVLCVYVCMCVVCVCLWSAHRYHLGSIAFGALIIAIVQFVRLILKTIESQLKGKENAAMKFMLKMMDCCLRCFEKFLKFITRNAYIEVCLLLLCCVFARGGFWVTYLRGRSGTPL